MAKLRYLRRDPSIDKEVLELINMLYKLTKSEEIEEPVVYGKYVRVAFVLVVRPEEIEAMLEPHVRYVKHVLEKYRGIRSIYILVASKNVAVARALRILLENELKAINIKPIIVEHVYESPVQRRS